jgi:hypothetical protein
MNIGDRLLIQGDLRPVPGIQQIELTEEICASWPDLREAVESLDWSWLRLEATRIRLTSDEGDERWIRPQDVAGAEPDPLVLLGPDFTVEVAEKLADQVLLIAKTLGGRWLGSSARVVAVDRYGLTLSVTEPAGTRASRVPFPERLDSPDDVHAALGALVMAARAAARTDETAAPDEIVEWDENSASDEGPVSDEHSVSAGATTLLDAVESDRSGGADVDGVDGTGHGYSNALINGLQHAAAQTRALGPEQDGESILLTEAELFEGDGIRPWREGEQMEPVVAEDAEPFGEGVEPSVGEGVGLAHRDTAGPTVERVTAGRIAEEGVDTEPGCAPQDDTHVGGVVDVLEDDDGSGIEVGKHLER